jgi:hypothetical protein
MPMPTQATQAAAEEESDEDVMQQFPEGKSDEVNDDTSDEDEYLELASVTDDTRQNMARTEEVLFFSKNIFREVLS